MDGEPGWKRAGYYTESTAEYIQRENIVLIDLRDPEVIAKTGYIPKAVNIPMKDLEKAEGKFPSYTKAPIVVYSDKKEDLEKAVKIIKKFGYPNVTVYSGGLKDWIAKGLEVKKGPIPTEITYVRTYRPFEVSPADFERALKDRHAIILDVRTPEEFKKGHFPGAINIPVDDIPKKAHILPKDKPIYVHCVTGVRAEMGYHALRDLGFTNVKVLMANVEFEDGKYSITE
ncbi:MAG: rhodanese-like domain-containing protein [Caldimicrobium sp.]|nr:rhodanese-like domain-containing protein [Caldimicrobium sp.]MCX7873062.1 rhodanese-like domain-containing protein [Caldimicrobium sp.]MDW8094815.1 rhodanese-like domain-containing protein [Caldimicrobium sp.]